MAGSDSQFTPYLTGTQQDLLRAALASNKADPNATTNNQHRIKRSFSGSKSADEISGDNTLSSSMFASPQQMPGSSNLGSLDFGNTPYLGIDGDDSFDLEGGEVDGQQMFGSLPGEDDDQFEATEKHIKRKNSGDEDDEDPDSKRREGEDKVAKKPGRKPITTEPTTKRKAQNRAAQRAFRERKEQHLKDLETKVSELAKTAEADKQENGVLKAQVARLESELREYRTRLSSDANRNHSPTYAQIGAKGEPVKSTFDFDFPAFGALPGSQLFGSNSPSNEVTKRENSGSPAEIAVQSFSRQNSDGRSFSPKSQASSNGTQAQSAQQPVSHRSSNAASSAGYRPSNGTSRQSSSLDSFAGLFSPGLLNSAPYGTENNDYGFTSVTGSPSQSTSRINGTDSNSGLSRAFRLNSASTTSNNDSPSQSSLSQFNPNSSCGTSPEASQPSPPKDVNGSAMNDVNLNLQNTSDLNALTDPSYSNSIDWLASQNGGQFDPVLFGDYRKSQDAIVGEGAFNNGFFNDALPYDFGDPFSLTNLESPKPQMSPATTTQQVQQQNQQQQASVSASKALLDNIDKQCNGGDDDYGLPSQGEASYVPPDNMLTANKLWNRVQQCEDFQAGKFDLDGLCSELSAKARCSERGVVVPEEHVHLAFEKLRGEPVEKYPSLMWDPSHVNDAITKLGGSTVNWGGMGL